MNDILTRMKAAARLTRAGRLNEATALLKHCFRGSARSEPTPEGGAAERTHFENLAPETAGTSPMGNRFTAQTSWFKSPFVAAPERLPVGAQFIGGSYNSAIGSRPYKLFVPSNYDPTVPLPMVVMLHGCKQSPDDFAAGTGMNTHAEKQTCLVLYPEQSTSANGSKCWNWFLPDDQVRGRGEPAIIAGMTRQIGRAYAVDPRRTYVAGLSAGGAAAAIMAIAYPDLYAAVGVHSGLACGVARDLPSALATMRSGRGGRQRASVSASAPIPAIVFHGDQDLTVHPSNGEDAIAQFASTAELETSIRHGRSPGGRAYTCTLYAARRDEVILEHWVVAGGGHAWSGGSLSGSYTDPEGPDASAEMMRFFLARKNHQSRQTSE